MLFRIVEFYINYFIYYVYINIIMSFIFHIGAMFAGKTSSAIKDYLKYTGGKKLKGIIILNHIDTRYGNKTIKTHSNQSLPAIHIKDTKSIMDLIDEFDVFLIDEIQFFTEIDVVIKSLLMKNKIIIGSGLTSYHNQDPWTEVSKCIGLATKIKHHKGFCMNAECNNKGTTTHLIGDNKNSKKNKRKESSVDNYETLCSKCYYKHYI